MELAHTKYPELTLVVAGKGKYYFDIEKYLKLPYFKIDNRFIPDGELAAMIRECEFVVVPYVDATQSGVIMSARMHIASLASQRMLEVYPRW